MTVRGLSERYNTVLLNGSTLPSTEPNRRNLLLFDIIPSGLIDNIVIHKTATPDMSSEFAGGAGAGEHQRYSCGKLFKHSPSVQVANTNMYRERYLQFEAREGTTTWAMMMVQKAGGKSRGGASRIMLSQREIRRKWVKWVRQIPNNWGVYKYKYSLCRDYQFNIGRRLPLKNGAHIGIVAGGLFRHDETREDEERRIYSTEAYDFKGNNYVFRSSLGAVLNVAYQGKKTKVVFKNLYNHLFVNETSDAYGPMPGFTPGIYRNTLSISTINDIWQHRLEGEHAAGPERDQTGLECGQGNYREGPAGYTEFHGSPGIQQG